MKKFLSILVSAAVLAMPLAVISTPASAQTSVSTPEKPMHKMKRKARHARAVMKRKMHNARVRANSTPRARATSVN